MTGRGAERGGRAARAGTTTATSNGDLDELACLASEVVGPIAWCGNARRATHPVGSLRPNAWGLCDMLGNVREWSHDWYRDELGTGPATDPWGPETGAYRVIRGGSCQDGTRVIRAASRPRINPEVSPNLLGFRPARTLP